MSWFLRELFQHFSPPETRGARAGEKVPTLKDWASGDFGVKVRVSASFRDLVLSPERISLFSPMLLSLINRIKSADRSSRSAVNAPVPLVWKFHCNETNTTR